MDTDLNCTLRKLRNGQADWRSIGPPGRSQQIQRVYDLLLEPRWREAVEDAILHDTGKPKPEASTEFDETVGHLKYYLNECARFDWEYENAVDSTEVPHTRSITVREPYGIAAVIKSWNYPFQGPIWSIIPALLCGNVVVFKPSEHALMSGEVLDRLFFGAGIRDDIFSVVRGGPDIGAALVHHPLVDYIAFTGSERVGTIIRNVCARSNKSCCLELSGNDAAIVLPDADIEAAAIGTVWGAVSNSGQTCTGVKSIFVHETIISSFTKAVLTRARELEFGRDFSSPVSNSACREISAFLDDAQKCGATILMGGVDHERSVVLPTVLFLPKWTARLLDEEAFGPLIPMLSYVDIEEVISHLRQTRFGLGASIWTADVVHGRKIADRLDVGMVWINDVNLPIAGGPWAARHRSGRGVELCRQTFEQYTQPKHICINNQPKSIRSWWCLHSSITKR